MAVNLRRRTRLPGNRLRDAILSLQPTAYWPLDDTGTPLRSLAQNWTAAVTGSPTYAVAAPDPIGRSIAWPGGSVYASTATSFPNPSASISVLCLMRTTDATASVRRLFARGATSQYSWEIRMGATHGLVFVPLQSDGTAHANVNLGNTTAANDGFWYLLMGTFDGTTVAGYKAKLGSTPVSASNTTLTASWYKSSTAAVQIAAMNSATTFPGTLAHAAIWNDRIIPAATFAWLASIAGGG